VLAALADLGLSIVVTVGPSYDPAALGPQPSHVWVERFIPQHTVLPHCQLVISHGGSGSILGALAYGIPLLMLPIGADQIANARQCAAMGVGEMFDPNALEPSSLRAAVSQVLTGGKYRSAAEAVRKEICGLPKPEHALRKVLELAPRSDHNSLPSEEHN
jgi:MGT family glycosyltransferase